MSRKLVSKPATSGAAHQKLINLKNIHIFYGAAWRNINFKCLPPK